MFLFTASLWIVVILTFVAMAIALFGAFIIGPYVLAWRLGRMLDNKTAQRDSRGNAIPRTAISRVGLGNLSVTTGLLAAVGQGAMPETSLNTLILRPTTGLRLVGFGAVAMIAFLILTDDGKIFGNNVYLIGGITMLAVYSLIHTNTYTLRYDTEGFTTRDDLFRPRRADWRDVISLQDNGHYLYVIKMADGSKVNVPKYLVGIRDFLTYAKDQMAYHDRT